MPCALQGVPRVSADAPDAVADAASPCIRQPGLESGRHESERSGCTTTAGATGTTAILAGGSPAGSGAAQEAQLWNGASTGEAVLRGLLDRLRYPQTFMPDDLAYDEEAGIVAKGSFGCVNKATVQVHGHGCVVVAVKRAVRKWVDVVSGKGRQLVLGPEAQRSKSIMREVAVHQHVQSLGSAEVGYCVGWCWLPEPCLLTLWYPGLTLQDVAVKPVAARLPLPALLVALLDVANGIVAVQQGACGLFYVHADIKPNNIALTMDHRARLIDLGVALEVAVSDGEACSEASFAGGPPGYCAPELRLRRVTLGGALVPQRASTSSGRAGRYYAGRYTDVYSLAATIMRVLAYGDSSEQEYMAESSMFGTDHRRDVVRLAHMEFHARQRLVSQLAAILASIYPSTHVDTTGIAAHSAARMRLASVLLECLQVDRKARPCITAVRSVLQYCVASAAEW
jgi:serine/threonine protein kinase